MGHALSGLIAIAVIGWLFSQKASVARQEGESWVMEYGPAWQRLVLASVLVPVAVATLPLWVRIKEGDGAFVAWMSAGFAGVVGWLLIEVKGRRFVLDAQGILALSPWARPPKRVAWKDIEGVEYSEAKQLVVVRAGQHRLELSRYLSGFESLAEGLRRYARPGFVDAQAVNMVLNLARP